jgi:hypothetical protein
MYYSTAERVCVGRLVVRRRHGCSVTFFGIPFLPIAAALPAYDIQRAVIQIKQGDATKRSKQTGVESIVP